MVDSILWVEKYRPKSLGDVALTKENRAQLDAYLKKGEIPHLLLHGTPGVGKTSVARIITSKLDCQKIVLNASAERGIDAIRDKVGSFARIKSIHRWNIIFLDESDALTTDAQTALRNLIEAYTDNTRFILTCNYLHKIIDAIQSRCAPIELSETPMQERARILNRILKAEGVEQQEPSAVMSYAQRFKDLRKMLSAAQRSVLAHGKLVAATKIQVSGEEVLDKVKKKEFAALRVMIGEASFDPPTALRELFWAIPDADPNAATFRWMVAKAVHEAQLTPDPYIHFLGLCAEMMDKLEVG